MAFEVLLRRNIEGVGNVGEVVGVKPGFARNYLIPKGYAARVTPDNLRRIEKDRKLEAVRQAQLSQYRSELSERLSQMQLTVEARAGEEGHLYGSVGPKHVVAALAEQGLVFEERQVRFEPVRELGEFEIPVQLGRDVTVDVKLWVVQDRRDVTDLAAASERRAAASDDVAKEAAEEADGSEAPAESAEADGEA